MIRETGEPSGLPVEALSLDRLLQERTREAPWLHCAESIPLDHEGPTNEFVHFEDGWVERPIVERFEDVVIRYGDNIAVNDSVMRLTYQELRRASLHLAQHIEMVAPPGRPVGLQLPNTALFPIAALACLAAGRPYVPLDINYPIERTRQIVAEASLSALVVERARPLAETCPPLPHIDIANSLGPTDDPEFRIAAAASPAVILYTSGSTGRPKGLCNDQRAILQRVAQAINSCHLHSGDRHLLLSSPSTIAGTREIFAALLNGATLYMADPYQVGLGGVLRVLEEARITVGYTVPGLLRLLLKLPRAAEAFRHMRVIRVGGDIAFESDLTLCRSTLPPSCHILIAFSSTEVPTIFQWFVPRNWQADGWRLPVGYACPGMEFMLLNDDGMLVPTGESGELLVRSRYLALGQWQDGHLQPGRFVSEPSEPAVRILRTGDIIRLRRDGLAEMIGRKDRQIKMRGLRVDPSEAEAALRGLAGVADAAVIPCYRGEEVAALVAFVVPRDQSDVNLIQLVHDAVAAQLSRHIRPFAVRLVDEIPYLPGFKIDIRALERLEDLDRITLDGAALTLPKGPLDRRPAGPENSVSGSRVRDVVESAWTDILNRQSFKANMPWDQAGGDSLGALQLWFRIEVALGRRLALDGLEPGATPDEIIAAVDKRLTFSSREAPGAQQTECLPLVFMMPTADGDVPMFARFCAAFEGRLRIVKIDYPAWRETIDAGAGFDLLVAAALLKVQAQCDDQPFMVAGYSLGGWVAWETARRLTEEGRRVSFVGLIDTQLKHLERVARRRFLGKAHRFMQALHSRWRSIGTVVLETFLVCLIEMSALSTLRGIGRLTAVLPANAAFRLDWHLMRQLRLRSLHRWAERGIKPLEAPATLFRSGDHISDGMDYGLGALCRRLSVVTVGGPHESILETPSHEILCARFLEAVTLATANCQRRRENAIGGRE